MPATTRSIRRAACPMDGFRFPKKPAPTAGSGRPAPTAGSGRPAPTLRLWHPESPFQVAA